MSTDVDSVWKLMGQFFEKVFSVFWSRVRIGEWKEILLFGIVYQYINDPEQSVFFHNVLAIGIGWTSFVIPMVGDCSTNG